MSDVYRCVPVPGGMLGGHYAVQSRFEERLIGIDFKLDASRGQELANELNRAHDRAYMESRRDPEITLKRA